MIVLYHQSKTPISFWVFCSMCKISLFLFNLVWRFKICDNFSTFITSSKNSSKCYWWKFVIFYANLLISFELWYIMTYVLLLSFFFFFFFGMKRQLIRSTKWGFWEQGVSRDKDGGRHRGEGFRWHIAIWEWERLSSSSLDILVTLVGTFPGCCQCYFSSSMWLIVEFFFLFYSFVMFRIFIWYDIYKFVEFEGLYLVLK